ncbi:acetyl-CoA C-acyltransferase, partial [Cellulomonas septica]|nr:acetyl-CoA C-acyltransferase [Cellulomonas septica]
MTGRDAVLVSFARTPMTRLGGAQSTLTAATLGAAAIRGAVERARIRPTAVDAVLMGQVVLAGSGQNPARQAAHLAGLPWTVPATTVNKVCLSGLTAIIDAARLIRCDEADVVVAGGQESMSLAPHLLPGSRRGWTYGDITAVDSLARDGLTDAFDGESMGASTERGNAALGITRFAQDEVALASHLRAAAAVTSGVFAEEIVPVPVPQRRGDPVTVDADEGIRPTRRRTPSGGRPPSGAGTRPSRASGAAAAGPSREPRSRRRPAARCPGRRSRPA